MCLYKNNIYILYIKIQSKGDFVESEGDKLKISIPENKFESLSIKKNNLGHYVLYGLLWWEYTQDDNKVKTLVSVKSENLVWEYNIHIMQDNDYIYNHGIRSMLINQTRQILHNFSFKNIFNNNDVLVNLTVLNDGKDGFMKYNIYEGLENYTVKVNVAGVKKEEIKVTLENEVIRVKTKPNVNEMEDMNTKVEMFEPIKGDIEIYLPNVETVDAKLEDGILTLIAPKQSKGVKIEIQ